MDFEETMVENTEVTEADDTLPEEITEETDESEESLDSAIGEEEEQPAEEPAEPEPQATEPGWIKKRVEKAVSKAVAQALAQQQAEFDRQMAPLRAKLIEDEAQELVRSKKVLDIDTARELVRLRNGQPAAEQPAQPEQPRQAGNAPKDDPATTARISMLRHQADRIRENKGPDVIAEFQSNPEIKKKVISGEMDFYDVADAMKTKKKPPAPMRSPNGASGTNNPNAIESMSREQFARMEKRISEGARIRLS